MAIKDSPNGEWEIPGTLPEKDREGAWVPYALVGLVFLTLLSSLWSVVEVRLVGKEVLNSISSTSERVARTIASDVFQSDAGWRVGQFPPNVQVVGSDGQSYFLRDLISSREVIYVGWDECPACNVHYPDLNSVAERVADVGGSFTLLVFMTGGDLPSLIEKHGWNFPVYQVTEESLLELNIRNTPSILVLRNQVLGHAFLGTSIQNMVDILQAELLQAS